MLTLRDIDATDSDQMLAWRNKDDVRQWMYTDHVIEPEEHVRWFTAMRRDPAMRYWIIERDGVPIGVTHLTAMSLKHLKCEWGIYLGVATTRGTGAAEAACFLSLDAVFHTHDMHRVTCEVLAHNERALRLYERVGFRREGYLRSFVAKGSERCDVVTMALLRPEWDSLRPGIVRGLRQRRLIDWGPA